MNDLLWKRLKARQLTGPRRYGGRHENTSVSDWQVHNYGSTVRTASWRQRSEAAHSQVTQWQAVGFLLHFHPKLDAFLQATPELQIYATLPFDKPNAPESLDVGTSTYADDIIREIPGIPAENVITGINRSSNALDTTLTPDYVQNSSKQEILPHFSGRGSHAEFRIIFGDFHNLEGRVHRRVRYLGPHIAFDGRLGCETSRRVPAARNTYSLFKRFFAKTESLRWRRVVFRAVVVGVALSGLVASAPSSTETNETDKCLHPIFFSSSLPLFSLSFKPRLTNRPSLADRIIVNPHGCRSQVA